MVGSGPGRYLKRVLQKRCEPDQFVLGKLSKVCRMQTQWLLTAADHLVPGWIQPAKSLLFSFESHGLV